MTWWSTHIVTHIHTHVRGNLLGSAIAVDICRALLRIFGLF